MIDIDPLSAPIYLFTRQRLLNRLDLPRVSALSARFSWNSLKPLDPALVSPWRCGAVERESES